MVHFSYLWSKLFLQTQRKITMRYNVPNREKQAYSESKLKKLSIFLNLFSKIKKNEKASPGDFSPMAPPLYIDFCVWLLCGVPIQPAPSIFYRRSCKGTAAHQYGLFSCELSPEHSYVPAQGFCPSNSFPTGIARIWLLTCVGFHVLTYLGFILKSCPTCFARILLLLTCVHSMASLWHVWSGCSDTLTSAFGMGFRCFWLCTCSWS